MFSPQMQEQVFLKYLKSLARKRLQVLHSNKKDIKPCEKDGEPFCWTPCTTICHSFENDPGPWKSFFLRERNVLFLYNDNSVFKIHIDHLMKKCIKKVFFSSSMVSKLKLTFLADTQLQWSEGVRLLHWTKYWKLTKNFQKAKIICR